MDVPPFSFTVSWGPEGWKVESLQVEPIPKLELTFEMKNALHGIINQYFSELDRDAKEGKD